METNINNNRYEKIGKSLENNLHTKNLNKLQCGELFAALRERKEDIGTQSFAFFT